jgi:hypothetical protein
MSVELTQDQLTELETETPAEGSAPTDDASTEGESEKEDSEDSEC